MDARFSSVNRPKSLALLILETQFSRVTVILFFQQQVKEKNATANLMNEEQIYCGYSKGLQLGLDLLFPSLTLAFSGLKLLWKTYIKDTYIGKKLVDVNIFDDP